MNKYKEALNHMTEVEELKRIIEILDQEGVEKCEKLDRQAKQIKQLEKAFNVACKLIFKSTGACPLLAKEFYFPHCEKCINTSVDCWEKYCLKIVKNDKLTKK